MTNLISRSMTLIGYFSLSAIGSLLVPTVPASAMIEAPFVQVPWNKPTGQTATSFSYGLNGFQAFDPNIAGNPGNNAYKTNVASMRPGILRYHNMQMLNDSRTNSSGWVISPNTRDYQWDRVKITNALNGSYSFKPVVMMNIPSWPKSMDDGTGKLRKQDYEAFAKFCTDLLKIVNVDLKKGVRYWEITNEKDGAYSKDMAELGRIYSIVAKAMKQVDPNIKVGGPSFTSVYPSDRMDAFLSTAVNQLDFISYHSYSTGTKTDTPKQLWDAAANLGNHTVQVKQRLAKYPNQSIETFHNEFNISYAPPDERMTNQVSAVFDALALIAITNAGATGSLAWNESDGWYGKLDNQWGAWSRRPASYVYQLFNTHLQGQIIASKSTEPQNITSFAVKNQAGYSLALVNRSQIDQMVPITFTSWDSPVQSQATIHTVSPSGYMSTNSAITQLGDGYVIPANSVVVVTVPRR